MSKRLKTPRVLDASIPAFGAMLRGARLGWRWSQKHGGFVRLSVVGHNAVVQLWPNELMPSRKSGEYVVWWDDPSLLDEITELRHITRVKRPVYFEVPLNRELGTPR